MIIAGRNCLNCTVHFLFLTGEEKCISPSLIHQASGVTYRGTTNVRDIFFTVSFFPVFETGIASHLSANDFKWVRVAVVEQMSQGNLMRELHSRKGNFIFSDSMNRLCLTTWLPITILLLSLYRQHT